MLILICLLLSRVALFVRAWIEIRDVGHMIGDLVVALFVRAWIEIGVRLVLSSAV